MNEEATLPGQIENATENKNDILNTAEAEDNDLAANSATPPSAAPAPPAPEFHLPAVSDIKQQATDTATQAISQAKDTASQALDMARKQVTDQLTTQKNRAADSLGGIKDSFSQIGETFAKNGQPAVGEYARSLSTQVDSVAGYLRDSDLETLGRDAQEFARQNPVIVIGGAFLVGIAIARFFKSSESNAAEAARSQALVPYTGPSRGSLPSLPTSRQDIDLDDAFTRNEHPLTANGYVSGGVLGGAPA